MMKKSKKIYVAMSGGVDSSVAAALLVKQGYEVTGVFFKPWSDSADVEYCNWREDRYDALRVAARLKIKFKTWDFSREYGKLVTKYMLDAYRIGITPNPDVMCNKKIKFGLFLKKALSEGADYIATGHYARIGNISNFRAREKSRCFKLLQGIDSAKDQSYFLYNLTQKELKYCLFPIGEYTKPEVRKLAKKFKLANHSKKDSQGVCFVGALNMKKFLQKHIPSKIGKVKLIETNESIGTHDGACYYTIGQRHGLNLGIAGGPYFVVKKNIKNNVIYVSNRMETKSRGIGSVRLKEVSWVNLSPASLRLRRIRADVKIRYRSQSLPATIEKGHRNYLLKFKNPIYTIAAGQSAVFYKGDEVLGGGIII